VNSTTRECYGNHPTPNRFLPEATHCIQNDAIAVPSVIDKRCEHIQTNMEDEHLSGQALAPVKFVLCQDVAAFVCNQRPEDRFAFEQISATGACGVTRVMACYELTLGRSTESTTISDRVLSTIVFSSACSSVGTANLSNVC
jgi:hypothetical protein